jgi:hypothetical protein
VNIENETGVSVFKKSLTFCEIGFSTDIPR